MISDRHAGFAPSLVALFVLAFGVGSASAEEWMGKVKSVDVATKKIVVTDKATDKDREFTVGSGTSWTKEKKGKVSKKFDLSQLKIGSQVEVTSEGTAISHVVIKTAKKKAKAA